jgi:hypothetical protein
MCSQPSAIFRHLPDTHGGKSINLLLQASGQLPLSAWPAMDSVLDKPAIWTFVALGCRHGVSSPPASTVWRQLRKRCEI